MTDAELELLRDELYALADTAISEFVHQHRRTKVVTARRSEVAAAGNKDEIGHVKRSQPTEIESDCEDWIIIGYVDLKAFAN